MFRFFTLLIFILVLPFVRPTAVLGGVKMTPNCLGLASQGSPFLECVRESPRPSDLPSLEQVQQEVTKAKQILAKDYGLESLYLKVDLRYLATLMDDELTSFNFSTLTERAVAAVFDDLVDLESPMRVAMEDLPENREQPPANLEDAERTRAARQFLWQHLNQSSSQLSLYSGTEESGFPPENGETLRDNWIFVLQIPTLSDHIFWVIFDKKNARLPYIYGFN